MFELTDQVIDSAALRARIIRPEAGACVVFEGWVRNHHKGRPVTLLEYEAFDELARLEGEAIVTEAEQAYPGCVVLCVHRTGSLPVGELAVWIGVASSHRQASFLACRQVIEELKRRLPVWKKEHHPDGAAEWVNCTVEAAAGRLSAEDYYERQVSLPEVGATGQAALASANVLVVGVGGLGCPAGLYLTTSGIGRLALVDEGLVEISNLHRQILFTADDVGIAKVTAAAARLKAHNPLVQIEPILAEVTAGNARALVAGRTVVLDCTDNFATRFLLHDACRQAGVPLVQAAVYRFEGELNLFDPRTAGCLHCMWSGRDVDKLASAATCAGDPVFAPAAGMLGIIQASGALKLILRMPMTVDFRHTRLVNLMDGSIQAIERPVDPSCPVCGQAKALPVEVGDSPANSEVVLQAEELATHEQLQIIALLEAGEELDLTNAPAGAVTAPIGDLLRIRELAGKAPTALTCRYGLRSAALARLLRSEGLGQIYALAGGSPAIRRAL